MTEFLTEADLAETLGTTEAQVAEWRRRYGWPHIKLGRQIRFTHSDIRAITAQHHVAGTEPSGLPDQTARSAARSA